MLCHYNSSFVAIRPFYYSVFIKVKEGFMARSGAVFGVAKA